MAQGRDPSGADFRGALAAGRGGRKTAMGIIQNAQGRIREGKNPIAESRMFDSSPNGNDVSPNGIPSRVLDSRNRIELGSVGLDLSEEWSRGKASVYRDNNFSKMSPTQGGTYANQSDFSIPSQYILDQKRGQAGESIPGYQSQNLIKLQPTNYAEYDQSQLSHTNLKQSVMSSDEFPLPIPTGAESPSRHPQKKSSNPPSQSSGSYSSDSDLGHYNYSAGGSRHLTKSQRSLKNLKKVSALQH